MPLAVIHVVGAVDAAGLYAAAKAADVNAKTLASSAGQGYVVRIDLKGKSDREKVQFYRAKPNGELYPLSASTFPDLATLKVRAKLYGQPSTSTAEYSVDEAMRSNQASMVVDSDDAVSTHSDRKLRAGFWLGLVLIVLAIVDALTIRSTGEPILQTTHVLLLVGAVMAFLLA